YWKVPPHFADWPAGYNTSDNVTDVFDIPDDCVGFGELADDTLLQALEKDTSGEAASTVLGGAKILLRAAVAAVLNSAHPDVNYPRPVGEVITAVNQALASCDRDTMISLAGELDRDNNLGCPLGQEQDGETLLGGACFNITPDPYDGPGPLNVCDNDENDADATNGTIRLQNIPCGNYTITEYTAPPGYIKATGSQNVTVTLNETETVEFTNARQCDGCLKIYKYEDKNGNGGKDDGEPYLS
ncbi:unnamed protein product, partial [marine sediment metagenome]